MKKQIFRNPTGGKINRKKIISFYFNEKKNERL